VFELESPITVRCFNPKLDRHYWSHLCVRCACFGGNLYDCACINGLTDF